MTMQNGHDANIHILHPADNGTCHTKLIEVHPSNISWHLLLAMIFNSSNSSGTYHCQRVAKYIGAVRRELSRAANRVKGLSCDPFLNSILLLKRQTCRSLLNKSVHSLCLYFCLINWYTLGHQHRTGLDDRAMFHCFQARSKTNRRLFVN